MTYQPVIIEDFEVDALILNKYLNKSVFNCTAPVFNNGLLALNFLKDQQNQNSYLIFLDLNMPTMNGWEFLDAIVKQALQHQFKIIITTSSVNVDDRNRVIHHPYVLDYVEKPVNVTVLNNLQDKFNLSVNE